MKVYKYSVDVGGRAHIAAGRIGKVVHFGPQYGELKAWVEVEPASALHEQVELMVIGTGRDIPAGYTHCASAIVGTYVWHLYEKRSVEREKGNG